jgi:hypothetical protein
MEPVDQRGRYSNLPTGRLLALFVKPEWQQVVRELHKLTKPK